MYPKFDLRSDPAELLCPNCGFNYLHHFRVEVFDRAHTVLTGHNVQIDHKLDGNPSRRSDGLSVFFYCERCPKVSRLDIAQHKGNTHVEFLVTDEPPPKFGPASA